MVRLIPIIFLFWSGIAFSQEQSEPILLLKTGHKLIEENIDELEKQKPDDKELFQGMYYRIVQFHQLPGAEERKEMEAHGLTFLDYLPRNAYFTAIDDTFSLQKLQDWNVRSVTSIKPDDKISDQLRERPFPDWAKADGGGVKVVISYYDNLPSYQVKESLQSHQMSIIGSYDYSNLVTVAVAPSEIKTLATFPYVQFLELPNPPAEPEDLPARTLHRSNKLASPHNNLPYNGSGVTVAVGDDGIIGPHIDYQGRLNQDSVLTESGDHGDMVSGIFMGAGNVDPTVKGMAYGAFLHMYDVWRVIRSAPYHHSTYDVKVTNTSFSNGCNAGYTSFTQLADQQINNMPTLLHVFSAGNNGNSDCGYGAGSGWGNVTGGIKIAKNVMCVANLDNEDNLAGSSSRGPAEDGRIKPDISANGVSQLSTDPVNGYDPGGGTSAASPSVAGVNAQLIHAFRSLNGGSDPQSALIKAIMLNTADDLGNKGPDFKHGWGRVNGGRALATIEKDHHFKDIVGNSGLKQHTINVPSGTDQLRVMVYWRDPAGSVAASKALVNNLDMELTDPSNNTFQPWVLDESPNPNTLDDPATRGNDNLNNMEQVTVDNPSAGNYTLEVTGASVPQGPQEYFVVYEFRQNHVEVTYPRSNEPFVPNTVEKIRWDAFGHSGTFTVEYSINGGNSWNAIQTGIPSDQRFVDWSVPNATTGKALVRVSANSLSDVSDQTFSIIKKPQNLSVDAACPGSFKLSWSPVSGATSYDVFMLGAKYMDSIGTTSNTNFTVQNINVGDTQWLSVRARGQGDIVGRRTNAIKKEPGIWNCPLPDDLAMEAILTPGSQVLQDCYNLSSVNVQVEVRNPGTKVQSNFPIKYQLNNGAVVSETFSGSIAPNNSSAYTFSTPVDISSTGNYTLKTWVELPNNDAFFNDTITSNTRVINSNTVTAPYSQDFESFSECSSFPNCSEEVCNLTAGWVNLLNEQEDDIDWRVDDGGTPSNGTGPTNDHNPGTSNGNYLYLEASGGCHHKVAQMLSPCMDLSGMTLPTLTFWYHMDGSNMGELHLDVFDGNEWHVDHMPPLKGDQGNTWQQATVSLTKFAGQTITLQFRGITGDEFRSDVAIDDIGISEWTQAPVADFRAESRVACVNTPFPFIDQSKGAASYSWSFTPATVTFLNGTNANSANPIVQFNSNGSYTVEQTTTNSFGNDKETKTAYVEVNSVTSPPVTEDFEGTPALPSDWSIRNPDGSYTWQSISNITGKNGQSTQAMFINFFDYNNGNGERDILKTVSVDLSNASSAELSFDIAYAPFINNVSDRLMIEVSTDCGQTFTPVYDKQGSLLATAAPQSNSFQPGSGSDWRSDTVNLNSFRSQNVVVRFVGENSFGNNLYLDNINLRSLQVPTAEFLAPNSVCKGDAITVTSQVPPAGNLTFQWLFGSGASPSSASSRGPHSVTYATSGSFQISSIVTNPAGSDTVTRQINVQNAPKGGFSYSRNNQNVSFTDQSSAATTIEWHFGDGVMSMITDPTHTYDSLGDFDVHQIVSSACGKDTVTKTITVDTTTSIQTLQADNRGLKIYPNPNRGQFQLFVKLKEQQIEPVSVYNVQGQSVLSIEPAQFQAGNFGWQKTTIDLSHQPKGVYFIRVIQEHQVDVKKVIIE